MVPTPQITKGERTDGHLTGITSADWNVGALVECSFQRMISLRREQQVNVCVLSV